MNAPLRVGVIGRGAWGSRIIATLLTKTRHCEHAWDCDSKVKLEEILGPKFTTPSTVDFVIIATPYHTHAKLMEQCFDRAIPFIVEKPAANVFELQKLSVKYATSVVGRVSTTPFLVNHTFLFNPAIEAMVNFAHRFESRGTPIELRGEHGGMGPIRDDCNALLDYGSHGIALALWLSKAEKVHAIRLYCGTKAVLKGTQVPDLHGPQNFTLEAHFEHLKFHLRTGNAYPKKRLLYTTVYDIGQGDPMTHRMREFPERELLSYLGSDLLEMPFATDIDPLTNALDTFARVMKGELPTDERFGWDLPLRTMQVLETCDELLREADREDEEGSLN